MSRRKRAGDPRVGPHGSLIVATYEKDERPDNDKRSQEVQTLISEMIVLAHRRGRLKKEREDMLYVA